MQSSTSSPPSAPDSELVQACLTGNREAFGVIVARYQSLICSLAYSATGSFSRSEDLAQETFVAAWRHLSGLREPAKLRAWLCGIARRLISNSQRQVSREPAHLAEPFTTAHEKVASEASPSVHAINHEEEILLWRALERIPETYRVPLVLYYREQQSVRKVAEALELSEDAVKQRLVRGRTLLHEQVLAFVEGTLERSKPGQAFTLGVMTVLPALGPTLATSAGATFTHSAVGAKPTTWLVSIGAIVSAQVLWFVSSIAFMSGIGAMAGWQMGSPYADAKERRWVLRFWQLLSTGLLLIVLPVILLKDHMEDSPAGTIGLQLCLVLFYIGIGVPLIIWAVTNHQRIRAKELQRGMPGSGWPRSIRRWVLAGTLGLALLFLHGISHSQWHVTIPPSRVWTEIAAHPDARLIISESANGNRTIEIDAAGTRYIGALNADAYHHIQAANRTYEIRPPAPGHATLGWPMRRLPLVIFLGMCAGTVLLARSWQWKHTPSSPPVS
ncbi:MAG: sigma-70 family RNA polymerase sigma factor [Opitutaceae bacterium]|nr:sigma-70 family RNA polymerase sigma factor [Opitutaceae bacterium]